jgi:hypothetical protein
MSNEDKKKDVESVLESFLLEDEVDARTLQMYLQRYPEFATELTDLAREISCISDYPNYATNEGDDVLLAQAWSVHADATPAAKADPLALLQPKDLNRLASTLQVPRQVLAALRERRVIVTSISAKFLNTLASELACTVSVLTDILSSPTAREPAGSHKSDVKPHMAEKVDFARVLQDAGVEPSRVADLVAAGGDDGRH